jgi:hypothetical protein
MAESDNASSGRDTRLLALVITVAVIVLLVLARLRFPEAQVDLSTVTPAGLERLAARANYDDLAAAVRTAIQAVEPIVVSVDLSPAAPEKEKPGATPPPARLVPAIRLRDDLAVTALPAGYKPSGGGSTVVRAIDTKRELVIAAVPAEAGPVRQATSAGVFAGFAYVAVVEMTPRGLTASPLFIGRIDPQDDERWGSALLVSGALDNLPAGSLIFLLDGRFVGLTVSVPGGKAIAPAALLGVVLDSLTSTGTGGSR